MPGIKSEHDLDDSFPPGRRIGGPGTIHWSAGGQATNTKDLWLTE